MPTMQRRPLQFGARRLGAGFTLIEILIAIVIVGVLASVAFPTFIDQLRKSRRSEAFTALASMQQAQERWRSNQANYATTLSQLGVTSSTTSSGYYTLSVSGGTSADPVDPATGYFVTAEGVSGTSQGNDTQCSKLSVRADRGSITYAGCGSCSTFTYSSNDRCWSR